MKKSDLKKIKLPKSPGVYFFLKNKDILYIGKATNLLDRVKSYFLKDLIETRGPLILDMVTQAKTIKYQKTDTVLEALILESNLIKKHQPKYNTKEKDNKSFNFVCITNEKIPRVIIERGKTINDNFSHLRYKDIFGPFPNGAQLKEAMKIIRRIFPYVDEQSSKKNNIEFYRQLGLVPIEKEFQNSLNDYKKNIKNLKLFFQGKKKSILAGLKKDMMFLAKKKEFEKANEIKKKIFALNHINDVALIKEDISTSPTRIEAYDISHMNGGNMVSVMVVLKDGELNKKEYRKFIIKTVKGPNDTKSLEEILNRRFTHKDWSKPDLIVVDGGLAQINQAKQVLKNNDVKIPIVSVLKDDKHKAKAIIGDELVIKKLKKQILLANMESHRFAISFHKQKRNKTFL